MTASESKASRRGRPLKGREAKARYQVMLEPAVAEKLRRLGNGNLSAGIAHAAALAGRYVRPM